MERGKLQMSFTCMMHEKAHRHLRNNLPKTVSTAGRMPHSTETHMSEEESVSPADPGPQTFFECVLRAPVKPQHAHRLANGHSEPLGQNSCAPSDEQSSPLLAYTTSCSSSPQVWHHHHQRDQGTRLGYKHAAFLAPRPAEGASRGLRSPA